MRRREFYVIEKIDCNHCGGRGHIWIEDPSGNLIAHGECHHCNGKGFTDHEVDFMEAFRDSIQYM